MGFFPINRKTTINIHILEIPDATKTTRFTYKTNTVAN